MWGHLSHPCDPGSLSWLVPSAAAWPWWPCTALEPVSPMGCHSPFPSAGSPKELPTAQGPALELRSSPGLLPGPSLLQPVLTSACPR